MPEADFEKLGVFYLGRRYDLSSRQPLPELVLYDSRDLLTHAVCIGMTGSGKTGLCLSLLEEAAIDGIPVIAIDPKGDIGNVLLTFPELAASDFEPWVNAEEARRQGITAAQLAQNQAYAWRQGLAEWEQTPARIQRLRDAAEFAIYTPGSTSGIPVSILRSFAAPPKAVLEDADALADRLTASASSLLALLSISADPLRSREHILIASILQHAWTSGVDLDLTALIRLIQKPPFAQVGALDLEAFYPAKERFELSMSLNNLMASPGFKAWSQGQPLEIDRLLYNQQGKPRVCVFSIAHLNDQQRMFFTALLLNQFIAWMRSQSGTGSLRAVLYMDEIFGYFPVNANPPSKTPLLTLMKQARAFGVGVMLASQNPVDIDYKGLSNAGTWFIGRLQTERDKLRVLDGLEGAAAQAGARIDRQGLDRTLSQLGNRIFLMNDVHAGEPFTFQTRWTLSYLKGPLSRDEIRRLVSAPAGTTGGAGQEAAPASAGAASTAKANELAGSKPASEAAPPSAGARPLLPPGVREVFLPLKQSALENERIVYRPYIYAAGNVHFLEAKSAIDTTLQYVLLTRPPQGVLAVPDWSKSQPCKVWMEQLQDQPAANATFEPAAAALSDPKSYAVWARDLANWLYANKKLKLKRCSATGDTSAPRESERDFRIRLGQSAREKRDAQAAALKQRYAPRLAALNEKILRAEQSLESKQLQARDEQMQAAISVGATVLGAFMGSRRVSSRSVDRAQAAARRAGRTVEAKQGVEHAQQSLAELQARLAELNAQFAAEMAALEGKFDPLQAELTELTIAAKKSNVTIALVSLAWAPFILDVACRERAAFVPAQAPG